MGQTAWVYLHGGRDEPNLWTVGFYKPDGTWEPESDHATKESAAQRVAWLNGGGAGGVRGRDSEHREGVETMAEKISRNWTVEPCDDTTRPDLVILADGDLLARVFAHYKDGKRDGSVEVIARLMTAAPALLAVLKGLRPLFECGAAEEYAEEIEAAEAAIDKAEGR